MRRRDELSAVSTPCLLVEYPLLTKRWEPLSLLVACDLLGTHIAASGLVLLCTSAATVSFM